MGSRATAMVSGERLEVRFMSLLHNKNAMYATAMQALCSPRYAEAD